MNIMERYEKEIEGFIEDINTSQRPVVLFGAATAGVLAQSVLNYMKVDIKCFGDNNEKKQGILFSGLPVFSAKEIKNKYPDAIVFVCIASKDISQKIFSQLQELEYGSIMAIDTLAHMFLKYKLFKKISSEDAVEIMAIISQIFYNNERKDTFIINAVELSVTEKCNLRCKDCANGMQYYKSPNHYKGEIMIDSFKRVAEVVDIVELVRIMGGESFLHPQLNYILDELSKIENLNQIEIITNGTILPDYKTIEAISKANAVLYVSNYGEISVKKEQIKRICDENNICCVFDSKINGWDDFGTFDNRGRTAEENTIIFQQCIACKNYNTLRNGMYYHCPRSAHGANLGAIAYNTGDCIDILDPSKSTEQLRNKLKEFIYNTKCITACDFCNSTGKANKLPRIPAAIQLKKGKA
ncbi:MAG: radical SAM protein [Lutisporaceae bacterium]